MARLYTVLYALSLYILIGWLQEYCYLTKKHSYRLAVVILESLCYWVLHKIWSHPKIHYGTTHIIWHKTKNIFFSHKACKAGTSHIFSCILSRAQTQCFIMNMKWNSVPLYSQANDLNMFYIAVKISQFRLSINHFSFPNKNLKHFLILAS